MVIVDESTLTINCSSFLIPKMFILKIYSVCNIHGIYVLCLLYSLCAGCNRDQKDIGLLHMASVLQRLGFLDDAATILEVAVTFNQANLLYRYILAGIYVVCVRLSVYVCTFVYLCM